MTGQVPEEFRVHFLHYNRRVVGIAALTLGLSLVLWAVLYFFVYWVSLFAVTVLQGVDATQPAGLLPKFLAVAGTLCGLSLLQQFLWPYARVADRKSVFSIAISVIFALPKMTVSALQTLTAYRALNDEEMYAAWRVLGKIARDGVLTIQELPLEIPGGAIRRKAMMALQLTGLIQLQGTPDALGFHIGNEAGKRLGQAYVRIRVKGQKSEEM